MEIKLKPVTPYETAKPTSLFKYAIQSTKTKHIVAVFCNKSMADAFVILLNDHKVAYFTDEYVVREVYDGEAE